MSPRHIRPGFRGLGGCFQRPAWSFQPNGQLHKHPPHSAPKTLLAWKGRENAKSSRTLSVRKRSQGGPGTCLVTLRREPCPPPGSETGTQGCGGGAAKVGRSMLPGSLVPPRGPPTATARRLLGPRPVPGAAAPPRPEGSPRGGGVRANEGPSEGGRGLLMRASLFV